MTTPSSIRPGADEHAPYYRRYIDHLPSGDVLERLATQAAETHALLAAVPEARAGFRYAPGKWSVREVVGHLIDVERVMTYRALRIARGDATPLPGFDENAYVDAAGFDERPLQQLADELAALRQTTILFYSGLPADAWTRRGVANQAEITVRALAWITAGHERHHQLIFGERYLLPVPAAV